MDALELSEADAFARLQRAARNRNLRLAEVAQEVIDQRDLLREPPGQSQEQQSAGGGSRRDENRQ